MEKASRSGPGKARRALVIGRFQPLHRGHLHLIQQAAALADEVVVVVGSADKSHVPDNPFTAGERITMVAAAVAAAGIKVPHIIPLDDLGRYHLWVAHVLAHVPECDIVVTGSPLMAHLFTAAGHRVHRIEPIERDRLAATAIRARLYAGEDVADAVPPTVAASLRSDAARERLRHVRG